MNPTVVMPEMTIVWPKECPYKLEPSPKRICIDLDGVVCEYDFPKIVKGFFGVELKTSEIYAYDLPDVLGVSQAEINNMFYEQVYGKPNFIEGAIDTLKEWKSKGHELIIFSNRVKYMSEFGLAKWLVDYQIPFDDIDGGKGYYGAHIDDSPAKLISTNSKLKLLYTQPWNERCLDIKSRLIRVNNWQEVRTYV